VSSQEGLCSLGLVRGLVGELVRELVNPLNLLFYDVFDVSLNFVFY
jgi:uncharacterized membrane protein